MTRKLTGIALIASSYNEAQYKGSCLTCSTYCYAIVAGKSLFANKKKHLMPSFSLLSIIFPAPFSLCSYCATALTSGHFNV